MSCQEKHTKYQPPESEFKCPKCGAKCGDFYIDESHDPECDLLAPGDNLLCAKCEYGVSGQAFANMIKKKMSMVPCPHCRGTGFVKSGSDG